MYVNLQRLSEQALGRDAFVVPRLDGTPSPAPLIRLGQEIVATALDRSPETVDLEPRFVRRRFRNYDLQALPMPDYLAAERPSGVLDLFRDRLGLGVGDAVLLVAALNRRFLRWLEEAREASARRPTPSVPL